MSTRQCDDCGRQAGCTHFVKYSDYYGEDTSRFMCCRCETGHNCPDCGESGVTMAQALGALIELARHTPGGHGLLIDNAEEAARVAQKLLDFAQMVHDLASVPGNTIPTQIAAFADEVVALAERPIV